ncbi:hypothetical protein [Reichenbachiella sp.]|uniref:hypothetical protein n=1 Tax=Reichenbachiella sp. TaxID=2184521 RepID=UPI003B592AA1
MHKHIFSLILGLAFLTTTHAQQVKFPIKPVLKDAPKKVLITKTYDAQPDSYNDVDKFQKKTEWTFKDKYNYTCSETYDKNYISGPAYNQFKRSSYYTQSMMYASGSLTNYYLEYQSAIKEADDQESTDSKTFIEIKQSSNGYNYIRQVGLPDPYYDEGTDMPMFAEVNEDINMEAKFFNMSQDFIDPLDFVYAAQPNGRPIQIMGTAIPEKPGMYYQKVFDVTKYLVVEKSAGGSSDLPDDWWNSYYGSQSEYWDDLDFNPDRLAKNKKDYLSKNAASFIVKKALAFARKGNYLAWQVAPQNVPVTGSMSDPFNDISTVGITYVWNKSISAHIVINDYSIALIDPASGKELYATDVDNKTGLINRSLTDGLLDHLIANENTIIQHIEQAKKRQTVTKTDDHGNWVEAVLTEEGGQPVQIKRTITY